MSEDLLPVEEILNSVPDAGPGAPPWPNSMPVEGQVYGFTCPQTNADMVGMLKTTFVNFGTDMERMRRAAAELDEKCKELANERDTAAALLTDLQRRHGNLRAHLKADRLAKFEKKPDPIRSAVQQATTGK